MDTPHAAIGADGREHDLRVREALLRARQSPFYSRHLAGHELENRADLAGLPLTFKDHLREATPFGMLAVPPAKAWHYHESSGTAGEPISTWWGVAEMRAMAEMLRDTVPELSENPILLNRFPFFAPASFVFEEVLRMAGACHIPAGNMTWDVPFSRALGFIRRLGVTVLACLPLEAVLLREVAREQGLDTKRDFDSLRVIICGGAVLPPALRRLIQRDWNVRVVEIYGSNEAMGLGLGCVEGRLHLCSNLAEIELLHPKTHEPVQPGEPGVVTVTSLVQEVMPLVRYFTGDLVRLSREPCGCGSDGPTAEVLGRMEEVIEFAGVQRTAYDVLDAVYDLADRQNTRIFFILVLRRGLHVLMEVADPAHAGDHAADGRRLADRLGLPVSVEYLRQNDVLDRSAMFRTPRIYKPSLISDWRQGTRKSITIMEALLEWPHFDLRTVLGIVRRQVRNRLRRRRLLRGDLKEPLG